MTFQALSTSTDQDARACRLPGAAEETAMLQHCHSTPPTPHERPAHPPPDDLVIPPELDPPPDRPLPEVPPDEPGPSPHTVIVH
jgi:hypothetical protein